MPDGAVDFATDPLKHYVRVKGWLPLCKERLRRLKAQTQKKGTGRRLRYFTFCAVDAVDVLMLDIVNVIRRSEKKKFDTVCFFDKNLEKVADTQLVIPGAVGFAGDFTKVVLTPPAPVSLAAPSDEPDTGSTRDRQRLQATKAQFMERFPFDVVNLDLQDLMFTDYDDIPGDVINALQQVCEWQRRPLVPRKGQPEHLEGFTLLFTTRIQPENLSSDCAGMLVEQLRNNIAGDGTLGDTLQARTGATVDQLKDADFATFLELGIPKVLASILMEQDWHPEPDPGVLVFRFTRPAAYDILHFAMQVSRHKPPMGKRVPNSVPAQAQAAYRQTAKKIFEQPAIEVTEELVNGVELTPSLERIKKQRHKYYKDPAAS